MGLSQTEKDREGDMQTWFIYGLHRGEGQALRGPRKASGLTI